MIPLVIGAILLFNSSMGSANQGAVALVPQSQSVEEYVREYYADTPVLAEIARCESRFRQYDSTGQTLRGEILHEDVGIMQINERFHSKASKDLGMDIYTIDGNLAYAKYLFEKEGTKPWNSSANCWKKTILAQK